MGRLVVHAKHSWLGFLFALTGIKVEIDWQPTKVPWGQSTFDLPAGNYHLRVSTRWFGVFGAVELSVVVHPGQVVTVYYRPPAAKWMRGVAGFSPLTFRDMRASIAVNIGLVIVLVAYVFLVIV